MNTQNVHTSSVRSGDVVGLSVQNAAHEDLGEIAEMVVDKTSGRISYLVLDFGGFLGFGNKYFAVPWHSFTYDPDDDCFLLNIDKERLENAPGFDKDHWPDFISPEVTKQISTFLWIEQISLPLSP